MKTSCILHYAFRSKDPVKLGYFYADVFDGVFVVHPVMGGLGIVMVKLNHEEALFNGLIEFWPWDVVWDSDAAVFRKVKGERGSLSYGHLAVKIEKPVEEVVEELKKKDVKYRMEPRAPGFMIPTIDDPEGNMIELFCNVDHMTLPAQAFVPKEFAGAAMAGVAKMLEEKYRGKDVDAGYALW